LPPSLLRPLLIACLLPLAAAAQVVCALGPGAVAYKASEDKHPTADAMQLVGGTYAAGRGMCGTNCPEVILFRNTTASNVMLVSDAGRAKIVYNPTFITSVYERYGDAGVEAVMAHEIGHALDDTLGAAWIEKSWTPEVRADSWAGCILAKSNLSPADVAAALAALAAHPSPAHPAWSVRLPAIRAGYSRCGGAVNIP
jgi:hypothetical protein